MEIEQIYMNVDKIILSHLMINDTAMQYCQALGYNGFKRYHRYEAKYLMCKHQELETSYFDRYRKILVSDIDAPIYSPVDLKEHLSSWKNLLETDIQQLSELNQEHFDIVGMTNCIIEEIICDFIKKLEKVNRWISRFDESMWNSIDCRIVDDYLHLKMKKKEEGE